MGYVSGLVTVSSVDEARAIAGALVAERLAACANVIPGVESTYWWNGAIETSAEVIVLLKTRAELTDAVIRRVRELHSYECPCVVFAEIVAGSAPFIAWIGEETREPRDAEGEEVDFRGH